MVSAATVAQRPSLAGFSVYGANSSDGLDNRNPRQLRRFALRESPCLLAPPSIRIGPRRARVGPPAVLPIAGVAINQALQRERRSPFGPRIAASRRLHAVG